MASPLSIHIAPSLGNAPELTIRPEVAERACAAMRQLPPLIRPSHLARLLDVPRQRIYEYAAMGELDAVRIGKRSIRVTRESLIALLRRSNGLP